MLIWFLPLFLLFLMIGLPVFFGLSGGARTAALDERAGARHRACFIATSTMAWTVSRLMAIPFFMLAGELMNRGGITMRLVEFSQALMGHFRGGLAHVNMLSSMLFAGLSGSAVADTSALGSMLIPAMEKQGYTRRFSAAITAASSVIGPIIPPSGIMIIYAYVMGESVAALFLAGIVPGILVGVGLMVMVKIMADKYDFPGRHAEIHLARARAGQPQGVLSAADAGHHSGRHSGRRFHADRSGGGRCCLCDHHRYVRPADLAATRSARGPKPCRHDLCRGPAAGRCGDGVQDSGQP